MQVGFLISVVQQATIESLYKVMQYDLVHRCEQLWGTFATENSKIFVEVRRMLFYLDFYIVIPEMFVTAAI